MKKSVLITRIVCLSVALILVIVVAVLSSGSSAVIAGAGSGTNENITTVNEMSDMLESFADKFGGFSFASVDGPESVKHSAAAADKSAKQYESVTMHETSSVYASSNARYEGATANVSVNFQREMTYYITDYAAYYVVDCIMSSSSFVNGGGVSSNQSVSISMNMELYLDKSTAMVKFNRFVMSQNGTNITGVEKILGKWIEFDEDDGYVVETLFSSVNDSNVKFLKLLDSAIDNYKEEGFSKSGNVYTLTDDAFKIFVARVLALYGMDMSYDDDNIDLSGAMVVDLSNNSNPKVTFNLNEKANEGSNTARANENDVFEFKNINNTVIKRPSNVKTYSVEELEDILGN